ncbi:unnamed protein product [Triticum aestivum]|uniref:Uncharacterized protein n=1 Tax=Triticum aestivum TaxID=4565 RepID=A0A7H4LPG7_WHEAT|nr:unnamed protein product [Triticum aestivum]
MSAPTVSYRALLDDAEVNIGSPPLASFDFHVEEPAGEEEEEEEEEDVTEIGEEVFEAGGGARRPICTANYTEVEDVLLVKAWSQVGLVAVTGTDQTGKRYWQRIEDRYCKLKPKTGTLRARSYRSLQGRWELMKPACARWSAAMDQVRDQPPSGCVESDYEKYADLKYKDMAGSKGKSFPFKHCWALLQHLDKWKLRDQESAPKKSDMLKMDDSDEEGRNHDKPDGTKKGKERMKMEAEASSLREKIDQMIKSKETLTTKALELIITERKKEVKLAQLEARREDAKRKADMEERMIKLKEAKAWKEIMAEEKEHMMMSRKDMDEEQLVWWKEYKENIVDRKRLLRGAGGVASSTLRGESPMSGGGDGGPALGHGQGATAQGPTQGGAHDVVHIYNIAKQK